MRTLDLGKNDCFDFDVIVDDPDSAEVSLSVAPPVVAGLSLRKQDGFSARLRWCPTPAQAHSGGLHALVLLANDSTNQTTEKAFSLVLRRPAKPECSGSDPVIAHTVQDWMGAGDIPLLARVQDDSGLKHPPIVYYWNARPSDPMDLSRARQVSMAMNSGTPSSGVWSAMLPNPTAGSTTGLSERVYYKIVVTDNDDPRGSCDHTIEHPSSGVHEIVVDPGSQDAVADGKSCEPCRSDSQCGASEDLCVHMGTRGRSFCLNACSSDADCEQDYVCSKSPIASVDRRMGRLCTPLEESCEPEMTLGCPDDPYEDNDTPATATPFAQGLLEPLAACVDHGRGDPDWFALEVDVTSQLQVNVAGDDASDLDLAVTDEMGTVIAVAESLRTQEDLGLCLGPGSYRAQVKPIGDVRGEYGIEWSARPSACGDQAVCQPDAFEGDENQQNARKVDWIRGYEQSANTICSGDEDWYEINLEKGQMFAVELIFVQTSTAEDLDLHFYQQDGTHLTPCSEADPSRCSSFQDKVLTPTNTTTFSLIRVGATTLLYEVLAVHRTATEFGFTSHDVLLQTDVVGWLVHGLSARTCVLYRANNPRRMIGSTLFFLMRSARLRFSSAQNSSCRGRGLSIRSSGETVCTFSVQPVRVSMFPSSLSSWTGRRLHFPSPKS